MKIAVVIPTILPLKFEQEFYPAWREHLLRHDFAANVATFQAVEHLDCLHIVHDTGTWTREGAPELALPWFEPGKDTHVHRPDEGVFCKYIAAKGYQRIDFHTTRKFRHGITILKKSA